MSQQAEFLWIMGIIVITSLVWFNAAKTEQHGREARERDDKLTKLLEKPGTTLEDVRALVGDHAHFEGEVVDRERNGTVAK